MTHPVFHAESSVSRFGGKMDDYTPIHRWLDNSQQEFCDFRHRALRHHSLGVYECERVFGETITNSERSRRPCEIYSRAAHQRRLRRHRAVRVGLAVTHPSGSLDESGLCVAGSRSRGARDVAEIDDIGRALTGSRRSISFSVTHYKWAGSRRGGDKRRDY